MAKRDWTMTAKQQHVFENLMTQVEKHLDYKKHHQGYRGTERYIEGVRSFAKHLAIHYQSKNFKNISDKHVKSFIQESQKSGIAPATLKTELSAIRKFHGIYPGTRNQLSDNKELDYTDKRVRVGVDRAWNQSEFQKAVSLANMTGRQDVVWSLQLARYAGLRIEEVTALTKSQLRNSLETGYLSLKVTKGGIARDIPLTNPIKPIIRDIFERSDRDRIFVQHGTAHHQAFKSIQNWIYNHRNTFQEAWKEDQDSKYQAQLKIDYQRANLTAHGLRHSYAREQYQERIDQGMDPQEARKEVAVLLGHGRDSVTRIYLGRDNDDD